MFSLDIITKPGLLVFSHNFVENWLDNENDQDLDIYASLKTAAINALKETQGETITAIQQVGYNLLLYEGILTYGILTIRSGDNDPVLYDFLRRIVLKFEFLYTYELYQETIMKKDDFEGFRDVVERAYNELIGIDEKGLEKILDTMKHSNISNFLVYKTAFLHPVYMSTADPSIGDIPVHRITKIFRSLDDLSLSSKKDILTVEIELEEQVISGIRTNSHWIICLSNVNDITKLDLQYEVNKIRDYLSPVIPN